MHTIQLPAKTERIRVGGPVKVLLVVDPPPLLLRMGQVLRELPGVRQVGAFTATTEAVDWLVWDREGTDIAFVDLKLPDGGSEDVIRRLLARHRPGTVVALSDHLWREVREACAGLGVYHVLEKGDVIAFREFMQQQLR